MSHRDSNRDILFTHMHSLTKRLTEIQDQVENLINFSTEQLQVHAMEIEQIREEVEKLHQRLDKLTEQTG